MEFGSDELTTLLVGARSNNHELAGARARVIQSDARSCAAGGALLSALAMNAASRPQLTGAGLSDPARFLAVPSDCPRDRPARRRFFTVQRVAPRHPPLPGPTCSRCGGRWRSA